jgi:hypothetical protein
MAIAGSAIKAFAISWDKDKQQVLILANTTLPRDRCDSVTAACNMIAKGQTALVAAPEIEQVRGKMRARVAEQVAAVLSISPVPGWLLDEQGNVRPEKGEGTTLTANGKLTD